MFLTDHINAELVSLFLHEKNISHLFNLYWCIEFEQNKNEKY